MKDSIPGGGTNSFLLLQYAKEIIPIGMLAIDGAGSGSRED
jgi:hypothetical protein